jgi:transcriptional regulator with PAS, ATPase and Fis domain
VERAMIMKGGKMPLSSDDFPHLAEQSIPVESSDDLFTLPATGIDYEELQRSIVRQSLEMTMGNQSAAARLLNVSRARFRTLLGLIADKNGQIKIRLQNTRKQG